MSLAWLAVFALKALQKSMMFTRAAERGAHRRRGGRFPRRPCSLTTAWTFSYLSFRLPASASGFRLQLRAAGSGRHLEVGTGSRLKSSPLEKVQFDRLDRTETRHHHLQGVPVEVDVITHAVEAG